MRRERGKVVSASCGEYVRVCMVYDAVTIRATTRHHTHSRRFQNACLHITLLIHMYTRRIRRGRGRKRQRTGETRHNTLTHDLTHSLTLSLLLCLWQSKEDARRVAISSGYIPCAQEHRAPPAVSSCFWHYFDETKKMKKGKKKVFLTLAVMPTIG